METAQTVCLTLTPKELVELRLIPPAAKVTVGPCTAYFVSDARMALLRRILSQSPVKISTGA